MKPDLPATLIGRPQRLSIWWAAIRPRTLSISLTPVAVGSALAFAEGAAISWLPLLAALCCALLIQIGTNLHNDVVDFERGTDGPDRLGPLRVTAAGWVSAGCVRRAAVLSFSLALLLGGYLVSVGGVVIFAIGLSSLCAGWAYSGGPRPISHSRLGEFAALLFFGVVAVSGCYWLQARTLTLNTLVAGLIVGLPAGAVLLVNNYRDVVTDVRSGRRTLAAWLGAERSRQLYGAFMLLPFALLVQQVFTGHTGAVMGFLALPVVWPLLGRLVRSPIGPELNPLLAATARAGFVLGGLYAVGLVFGSG